MRPCSAYTVADGLLYIFNDIFDLLLEAHNLILERRKVHDFKLGLRQFRVDKLCICC